MGKKIYFLIAALLTLAGFSMFHLKDKKGEIKALIFDVDGVLIKTHGDSGGYIWSKNIKEDLGIRKKHFIHIFKNWNALITGKTESREYFKSVFKYPDFQDLKISHDDFIKYWLEMDDNIDAEMREIYDSIDLPKYLGTNQESLRSDHILNLLKIDKKHLFASYEIGYKKPSKEFFNHIEHVLSLKPKNIMLIDDKKENVEGALSKGWQAYHYRGDIKEFRAFLREKGLIK